MAIIASTALPPARRISAPASAAARCGAVTIPFSPTTVSDMVLRRSGLRLLAPVVFRLVAQHLARLVDRDQRFGRLDGALALRLREDLVEERVVLAARHRVGVGDAEDVGALELGLERQANRLRRIARIDIGPEVEFPR